MQRLSNIDLNKDNIDKLIRGKNINFLIGSGASVDFYPTLTIENTKLSLEDVITNPKIREEGKYMMYVYYFYKWIYPMKDIVDLDKELLKKHRSLISWIYNYLQTESNENPKRINIFTTNYDLLFERVFDDFLLENPLIYFNDGSRGVFNRYISNTNFYLNVTHSGYNDNYRREVPTVNLFKLHGSLSWEINENSEKIMIKRVNSNIEEIYSFFCDEDFLNTIIKGIEESCKELIENEDVTIEMFIEELNQIMDISEIIYEDNKDILKKFYDKYSRLPIINPDKYKFFKTVSEQHYYQMIRSFSYELEKKQTVLIVFGFSFADEHIKDIFERSLLNPELLVIIISYSKNGQEKMKKFFDKYSNVIFLPEFKDKEVKDKEVKGDFSYLLKLLGENNEG